MTIILVSHSKKLAEALKNFLIGMLDIKKEDKLKILVSGNNPDGGFGTNGEELETLITNSQDNDILIICDLGSAILSALSVKENFANKNIVVSKGSFVEGAFAAVSLAKYGNDFKSVVNAAEELANKY